LVIVAVLLALGAPSYRAFIVDSRMTAEANEFLTTMNFARSEAVKRNARVSMCKSANGTGCANSGTWAQGWIVFVDSSGTLGTFDSTDVILRVHAAVTTGNTMVGDANVASYVSFVDDGRSLLADGTAQAGTITLCPADTGLQGRVVTLSLGRAVAAKVSC
jgi:type IV fimbrial biogenesis protein FimT